MKLIPVLFLIVTLVVLTGCNRECECVRETVEQATPAVENQTPKVPTLSNLPAAPASPQVTGKWVGQWESIGHKGHGGKLSCDAVESGPQKWAATFTAEYGQVKMYDVKLEGKLEEGAVVFGGTVDLGKGDGGNFKWTGKATATEFTGKYEGGGDTGTFSMSRSHRREF